MRRIPAWTLIAAIGCGSVETGADAGVRADPAGAGAAEEASGLAAQLDAFVRPYAEHGVWGGAVLVARNDTLLFEGGYGPADVAFGITNTPDTRFGVASVSKAFTALAAARLAASGVIDLDAPLERYLPDFPGADAITLRHLLEHRAGVRDIDELPWFALGQRASHTLTELVDSLARVPLEFDPGAKYSYSNSGYILLAAAMESAVGRPFHVVLRETVFEPAGMLDSGDGSVGIVERLAEPYTLGPSGALVAAPAVHPSNKVGAGSAYSTVRDILAFHRALRDNILVSAASRDSLFGLIDHPIGERRMYFGGRGPGYTAAIQRFPGRDLLVVALGNNYSRLNEEISDGLVAIVTGSRDGRLLDVVNRRLPFPRHSLSAPRLRQLEGVYRHQWGFEFTLEQLDGGLVYVDPEHGTRSPMIPTSDTTLVSPWQWSRLILPVSTGAAADTVRWQWLDFPERLWTVERVR